jgi:hypothetical protein
MSRQHLFTSAAGVRYDMVDGEKSGEFHILGSADATALLDRNKAMATHNDGYNADRTMRRVASIPMHLIYQWLQEEGWNALDPDHADRLARKLNDPDYAYLRTAPGRLGYCPERGLR